MKNLFKKKISPSCENGRIFKVTFSSKLQIYEFLQILSLHDWKLMIDLKERGTFPIMSPVLTADFLPKTLHSDQCVRSLSLCQLYRPDFLKSQPKGAIDSLGPDEVVTWTTNISTYV